MKRALIVDDTKNIRTLLNTCLEIEEYKVIEANDGLQALELLKANNFDLIFLDIKLPHLSGTEVLRRLRELKIETPVVIMTAFATIKNAVECTKLGAVAYLQKPFTVDKVKKMLDEFYKFKNNEECVFNFELGLEKIENKINENKFHEALDLLKKAISTDPTNPHLFYLFGKAYEGIGDNENSQKFFKTYELFK